MAFEILGPVRVSLGGREIAITAGRERTLLALLLLHANQPVSVDRLIDTIWSGNSPQSGRNQLQHCVHQLRRRLVQAGVTGQVIVTEPAAYRAVVDPGDLDLSAFRRLVADARAEATAGRPDEAGATYRAALELWRGPALADVDNPALCQSAALLDEEHTQALEERLEAELAAGAGGELVAELTDLVRRHPHRERLQAALMLALYRAGRQADALAAYRHARQLFHDELGTEPGNELQLRHQAILNRDPALDARKPTQATAAPPSTPRELPADVAGFTGRAEALKALDEHLPDGGQATGPVVITAIAGTAGVGKTALAVHWAHRVARWFPDGQLYVNLRGYAMRAPMRPIEALSALLRSLGVPPDQVPVDEEEASARYRSVLTDRRVLILLDNAGSVGQVRPLLPGSAGCLVLVTSRDRLAGLVARDGAHRLTLDVMTADEAHTLLSRLLGAERIRAEPDAAAQLARVCAYLPLAVRIAAAMLDEHPDRGIGSFATELATGHRLPALEVAGDQQSAVGAAFDLSYRSIPGSAQRLFRLLGTAPGTDFTDAAAGALAGLPPAQAQRLLDGLAAAHLVDERAAGRYAFHDLLREYAQDRAVREADGDEAEALERLLHWYLRGAHAASCLLHPTVARLPLPAELTEPDPGPLKDRAEAIAWFQAERSNLVAAVEHAAEHGPRPVAWLLADALRVAIWTGMHGTDGLAVGRAALAAAGADGDLSGQAAAQLVITMAHLRNGDHEQGVECGLLAAELARDSGWLEGQASALHNLALVCWKSARLGEAIQHGDQAVSINRKLGRRGAEAAHLNNLGGVRQELGDLREAVHYHTAALSIGRETGNRHVEAAARACLGEAEHQLGRLGEALSQLTQALAIASETGQREGEAIVLCSIAGVRCTAGEYADALDSAAAGLAMLSGGGDHRREADALNVLAGVYTSRQEYDTAVVHYERALGVARQSSAFSVTGAWIGLALAQHRLGVREPATTHARRALDLAAGTGFRVLEGRALTVLAEIHLGQGPLDAAREYAERALRNHRETGHRLGEARTLAVLGDIARDADDGRAARSDWLAAQALFDEIGAAPPAGLAVTLGRA